MKRIFVNAVRKLDEVTIQYTPFHEAPLTAPGGTCDNLDWGQVYAGMTPPAEIPSSIRSMRSTTKIESAWKHLSLLHTKARRVATKGIRLRRQSICRRRRQRTTGTLRAFTPRNGHAHVRLVNICWLLLRRLRAIYQGVLE